MKKLLIMMILLAGITPASAQTLSSDNTWTGVNTFADPAAPPHTNRVNIVGKTTITTDAPIGDYDYGGTLQIFSHIQGAGLPPALTITADTNPASYGGLSIDGNAGEMGLNSLGSTVARYFWEGAPGESAVIAGLGANRLSIESAGALTQIAANSRFEWEGLGGRDSLSVVGYEAGSAIGRTIDFNNSGQTPSAATPLEATNYQSSINTVFRIRDGLAGEAFEVDRVAFNTAGDIVQTLGSDVSALTTTGYYVTGSGSASLLNLSGTWNTSGSPTGIFQNITNIASGSDARLIDLQVNGISQFNVTPVGVVNANAVATAFGISAYNGAIFLGSTDGVSHAPGITIGGGAISGAGIGGAEAVTTDATAIAVGNNASAANVGAIALGLSSSASGQDAVAIGDRAAATGGGSLAFGGQSVSSGAFSIASGFGAMASGARSQALGNGARATGDFSIASGYLSAATGTSSLAMGTGSAAAGSNSAAFGSNANAQGVFSIAAGYGAFSGGANSTALGNSSVASGASSVAVGDNARATRDGAVAVGLNASSTGVNAIAIGQGASATGSLAVGAGATAENGCAALGDNARGTGANCAAVGPNATASGNRSLAEGYLSTASGLSSVAVGTGASATASNAAAFGSNASATGANALALGAGAIATAQNSVALGSGSVATEPNTVSVGTSGAGGQRRITNVASGSSDFDAINMKQFAAAIVSAAAAPSVQMPSKPGNATFALNSAYYRGRAGFGMGMAYRLYTRNPSVINFTLSEGSGSEFIARAGFAFEF